MFALTCRTVTGGTRSHRYDLGHGVEQDHAEAVTWWTKAAEAGYANSQVNLFIAYSMGKGVGKDPVRAGGNARPSKYVVAF